MSNPGVRLSAAGFISILVTIILLLFMHYLMGGFNETATKRVFNLYTVGIVSRENDDEFKKPERVLMPPEFTELEDNIRQEAEEFLSQQPENQSVQIEPDKALEIEISQPDIENEDPGDKDEISKKRKEFISVLEEE